MNRRKFLSTGFNAGLATGVAAISPAGLLAGEPSGKIDERAFLDKILYTEQEVDDWFAGKAFPFSKYHPEFGWLLPDARFRDGINDSYSVYTYAENDGERIMTNYREKPCRINTYGNSFTQCHQVSDHETWQEVMAAHFQEPVRNFGIGGWSVYQAFLRMKFEETRTPADYILFNIYEDDHRRNLDSWRNIRVRKHPQHIEATLPHVRVDLHRNLITEHPNPCPTPESVYDLCSLDKTLDLFRDDFVLQVMLAHENAETRNPESGYEYLSRLIKTHGIETKLDQSETLDDQASEVHWKAALFSTRKIVEMIEAYAAAHGKKVFYILSYPGSSVARYIREEKRIDTDFVEFLKQKQLPFVDLMEEHQKDFDTHRLDLESYIDKYYIGHYNPLGNFFCAKATMDRIRNWLDPVPPPYRN